MAEMTEVGFYHLQTTALERVLPRLLAKAYEAGMRAVVLAGSGSSAPVNGRAHLPRSRTGWAAPG